MLTIYAAGGHRLSRVDPAAAPPPDAVWYDLLEPTKDEEALVERATGTGVPTREEMAEIEPSSRLLRDGDTITVTASVIAGTAAGAPTAAPVSFVLTPKHLITVRYAEPKAFALFGAHVERDAALCSDATAALIHLLDAVVDRLADVLEHVGDEMDGIAQATFRRGEQARMTNDALAVLLKRIGAVQDLVSKARISGVSLSRVLGFLAQTLDPKGTKEHLDGLAKDVTSLTDHASYLAGNVTFLLDAALGLINIEQNAIIKIFSVAAVIFMPPTLVASIYGMNFKHMPELNFTYGYPMALGLMLASAILPYLFFKGRGWL